MRVRMTCNLSEEQQRCSFDATLMGLHRSLIGAVMEWDWSVLGFSLTWIADDDGNAHLVEMLDLDTEGGDQHDLTFATLPDWATLAQKMRGPDDLDEPGGFQAAK